MGKNNYPRSVYRLACGGTKHTSTQEEVKPPIYYCYSCKCFSGNRCSFFNRPVIKNYNKCFHHSYYSPIAAVFREPENLDEIIKKQEEKQNCLVS